MTTNNLTEQWKKGELENGEYFALTNLGVEKIEYIKEHNGFGFDEIEWVLEVLAPVPSYEEWQQMKAFCEEFNALNVAEENKKLKELLKECREVVEFTKTIVNKHTWFDKILIKINGALK